MIIKAKLNEIKKLILKRVNRKLAILLAILFFYLAGILAQFLNNQFNWFPGKQLLLPSINPLKGFVMLFTPFGVQALAGLFCFTLISGLLFYMFREDRSHLIYDKKRNFYYSTRGTYGTAGWMGNETAEKTFDLIPAQEISRAKEIIYGIKDGQLICRRSDSMLNGHVAVFGASGSRKSRTFARNKIISSVKKSESLVVTDPKSELLSDTRQYLIDNGYTVKVLNLVNPKESQRFDALDGALDNPIMVSHIVEAVIANTGGSKGDHFFDAAEGNLLSALIFYLLEVQQDTYPTIGDAYKIILETATLEELGDIFDNLPPNSRASMAFNLFRKASANVQGNVIIGLGSRLAVLQNPEIADLMSFPDMEFTSLGKERCAYFLVISDQDNTMRFVTAMFFSLLFSRLVHYADNECVDKRLPIAVNLLLDEFPNLGSINAFHIKISTVRSRNINIAIIFQAIGQLENRYPDNLWSELLGNCDTQIFLGCTDPVTANYISERSGEVTIGVDTIMKQRSAFMPLDIQPNYRQSEGAGRRKLLTPDEVLRMEQDDMLIILRGHQILEAQKFDYTRNPESDKFRSFEEEKPAPQEKEILAEPLPEPTTDVEPSKDSAPVLQFQRPISAKQNKAHENIGQFPHKPEQPKTEVKVKNQLGANQFGEVNAVKMGRLILGGKGNANRN